jgi:hypothetical protein
MMKPSEALRALAVRLGRSYPDNPQRFQEALEASLLPMIRCALRNGTGLPAVVRWVERNRPDNPSGAAPVMARRLCATLVQQWQAHAGPSYAARETVVDR